jgi:hypothetical protein
VDPSFTPEGASAAPPVSDGKPEVKPSGSRRFRHGKGTFVDGSYSYSGEWDHDLMHGKGELPLFASFLSETKKPTSKTWLFNIFPLLGLLILGRMGSRPDA